MRVEKSGNGGFTCVRNFLRNALTEQIIALRAPNHRDASDYACPREPQIVRLVRHIAPNGAVRVLMTNQLDMRRFAVSCFGDLYHQRWGIEEAFKRLKHRLNLEYVSGLSQQAAVQDVAAKVLCDNLQALTSMVAHEGANLPESVRINHAFAHTALKPLLPGLLLAKKVGKLLRGVLRLIAKKTYRHRAAVAKSGSPGPKPHKYMTQKNC